jgi:hypothetical protein
MAQLAIQLYVACDEVFCALCGRTLPCAAGPRLVCVESSAPVCRDCGRKHAPSLVALLDLARTANRVARVGSHTIVPPLGVLLDLARAAENYNHATHECRRQAA